MLKQQALLTQMTAPAMANQRVTEGGPPKTHGEGHQNNQGRALWRGYEGSFQCLEGMVLGRQGNLLEAVLSNGRVKDEQI